MHGKLYSIELNKRFAYPASCLVLMLVGVPLGMSSRRGGKSAGFVVTILLVFLYYFLSSTGIALARQDKISAFIGVWTVNILSPTFGLLLLRQLSRRGGVAWFPALTGLFKVKRKPDAVREDHDADETHARRRSRASSIRPPQLSADSRQLHPQAVPLHLRASVLVSFLLLMLIFTFFELLGDIIRNRTPLVTVGEYLINLMPNLIYNLTPLCTLVAVLATFGGLNRTSELTAMKATGISLYRVMVPVLVIAAILGASALRLRRELSARRQSSPGSTAIRSSRASPPRHFCGRTSNGSLGKQDPGKPSRIYYYEFFDPELDRFANLSVFEFDPDTFALSQSYLRHQRPLGARPLHQWIFENAAGTEHI